MRTVFLGTPAFAVPSLRRLAASRHQVVAVVTNPDRPSGRGRGLQPPPVRLAAEVLHLPVLQPESAHDPALAGQLAALAPDLFAVVAFSVLQPRLLAVPRLGCVNLHPSLLPAYRGAAPIPRALFDGCTRTGITTILLSRRVDAGDLLLQEPVDIGQNETAGELEARLAEAGADLLVRTLDGLEDGVLVPRPQPTAGVSRAPKLSREDGRLDWSASAAAVRNRVRGANPVPGAFTEWEAGLLKVHGAEVATGGDSPPGTVLVADGRDGIVVACGDGALRLTEVQPEGRPRMTGAAFARGYPVAAGTRLGQPPGGR